ncbi:hypothetical protein [Shewanella colwelliana]|uniref:hypothetical protein n=1 Tax=Shewanella colwelliana TaxID=23 RepID=UPI003736E360
MKSFIISLLITTLFSAPLAAEGTPDGATPANEGVCDALQGGTPSLYGLCVAFCEAQDTFDEETPVTQETVDEYLASSKQSQRIYDKYNDRKEATDPTMPCIVIQQDECPCWTQDNLDGAVTANAKFFDTQFQTAIVEDRKTTFRVFTSYLGTKACRATYISDGGFIRYSSTITLEEAAVCKAALIDKASELSL